MITWQSFIYFGITAVALWLSGAALSFKRKRVGMALYGGGVAVFVLFVALFWMGMGRPPLRTMGETRLWYSLFLSAVTLLLYLRWRYSFLLVFGGVLSTVFVIINIAKPEIHSIELMPALQSAWFIPHVTIYMLAYAVMGIALIAGIMALCGRPKLMEMADVLTRIGSALILLGMLMGAVWAKQAWGDYWTWDAKENWALVTWLVYVSYMHVRYRKPRAHKIAVLVLLLGFLALQITWYGVNYFPAAQKSMHTYTMNK